MHSSSFKVNCTNPEWLGRAFCEKCHIRSFMMFSKLPTTAFDKTLKPVNHYLYKPGSLIYGQNSSEKSIYSVRRGMLKLEYVEQNGQSRIVRLLGEGSVLGLELLDGAENYSHNAIAIEQVDLCKMPVSMVQKLEDDNPQLHRDIRIQLHKQLQIADQWIFALCSGSAQRRVAHLIQLLHQNFSNNDGAFYLLHRDDMASIISISIETICRKIAKFKKKNILYKYDDHLYQCDISAIKKIAYKL